MCLAVFSGLCVELMLEIVEFDFQHRDIENAETQRNNSSNSRSKSRLQRSMKNRLPIILMFLLTAFEVQTAVRIEILNVQVGGYLPRTIQNSNETPQDGKWRASLENSPRDQFRSVVATYGLLQYLLVPLLMMLAILVLWRSQKKWIKIGAMLSVSAPTIAMSLMFYREYYQSLGW